MSQSLDQLKKNYQQRQQALSTEQLNSMHKINEQGQSPSTLFICCADSRIQPHEILGTDPGDLFILRNIANIVPAHQDHDPTGFSATLALAIEHLQVKNIIVMGHQHCSGIKSLCCLKNSDDPLYQWMHQAEPLKKLPCFHAIQQGQDQYSELEQQAVKLYLQRLAEYPIVQQHPDLNLFGWYYDLNQQQILAVNEKGQFVAL